MRSHSDEVPVQLTFGAKFKVSGSLKFVRVGQIQGYGKGRVRDEQIIPAAFILLAKSKSGKGEYTLLNHLDHRVHWLLSQYDSSSRVQGLVVDESEGAFPTENIAFLTGEVFAHQTSDKTLRDTFKEICRSKNKQDLVDSYVCTQGGNDGTNLIFNLTNLIKVLGHNSITKSTADTWIDSSLDPDIEFFAGLLDQFGHLETHSVNANTSDLKRLKRIDYYRNRAPFIRHIQVRKQNITIEYDKMGLGEEEAKELRKLLANLKRARELAAKWNQMDIDINLQDLKRVLRNPNLFLERIETIEINSPDLATFIDQLHNLIEKRLTHQGVRNESHS